MPTGPTTLSLPTFSGATRRLILINVVIFFAAALLSFVAPAVLLTLLHHLALTPALVARGELWQLVTYAFLNLGLLQAVFGLLSLWFIGAWLEGAFGARWLYEVYFVSAVGAAVFACAISYTHVFGLSPSSSAASLNAALFGLLIAVGHFFGDQEISLLFLVRMKARYLVAIYILVDLALLLTSNQRFDALVQLCGALSGYLYLRFVPRRGLAFAATERLYGMRNDFYRSKRRRAARKFEVYMGKQGREVRFDKEGRYIDPDADKDPTDKRWMN